MKRKDLDQFNDEFSDFSLSSPAWKIRRLVLLLTFCFRVVVSFNGVCEALF